MKVCLVLFLVAAAVAYPADEARASKEPDDFDIFARSMDDDGLGTELKLMYRIYDECSRKDLVTCLKMKAITFVDRALRKDTIEIAEGFALVRQEDEKDNVQENLGKSLTMEALESYLPRDANAKDARLDEILAERLSKFFETHTLRIAVDEETMRSLGEGRKKGLKKVGPLLIMGGIMKAGILKTLAFKALAAIAGKALLISKVALLLSAIIGLKKLFGNQDHGSYEVVNVPSHHYRSFGEAAPVDTTVDAQDLAYRGQVASRN